MQTKRQRRNEKEKQKRIEKRKTTDMNYVPWRDRKPGSMSKPMPVIAPNKKAPGSFEGNSK